MLSVHPSHSLWLNHYVPGNKRNLLVKHPCVWLSLSWLPLSRSESRDAMLSGMTVIIWWMFLITANSNTVKHTCTLFIAFQVFLYTSTYGQIHSTDPKQHWLSALTQKHSICVLYCSKKVWKHSYYYKTWIKKAKPSNDYRLYLFTCQQLQADGGINHWPITCKIHIVWCTL